MGLYFRKSVNLGGGVRLNFSKSGIGISAGVKGARISTGTRGTYANFSIPGTGVRYTTKISGPNSATRNTAARYPYVQTVTNSYTGQTRTLRASTQWELNSLVAAERDRMKAAELRQKEIERVNDMRERASAMTKQIQDQKAELNDILNHTLDIDDKLNWDKQYINDEYPEFNFNEREPHKPKQNSGGFFKNLFKESDYSEKFTKYEKKLAEYEQKREAALSKYLAEKNAFERNKREHNAEINYLKENFESSEKSAVEKYISIILSNSQYPSGIDMDFDVEYHKSERTAIISFLMPAQTNFPIIDGYKYSARNNEIVPQSMNAEKIRSFYEHVLFSICLRTIHEIFEAVYTNAVDKVIFNAYLLKDELTDDFDDFSEHVRCIFSVSANRELFENINLRDVNVENLLSKLGLIRAEKFEFDEIQPILV